MTVTRPEVIAPIDPDECRALLAQSTVGRLAFVDADGQQLVPVNCAWFDDAVHLRTRNDGFLASLRTGHPDVAFQIDGLSTVQRAGWSVTVRGAVHEVHDRHTINRVLQADSAAPWAGGRRVTVLALQARSVEGRRVGVADDADWTPRAQ